MGELYCSNCGYPHAYSDFSFTRNCGRCGHKFDRDTASPSIYRLKYSLYPDGFKNNKRSILS